MIKRVRICTLQYYIRPVREWADFELQVESLVETAADYRSHLVVFPEWFCVQLLTLGNVKEDIRLQIRKLGHMLERFVEMMQLLAQKHRIYICAGSFPSIDPQNEDVVYNDSYLFSPSGNYAFQGKMHMTRFEKEEWIVTPRDELKVFDTEFGRVAINICYDVEFPEIARAAARLGVHILLVPSCTDERQGFLRVRFCSHARAIENQLYVVTSHTVGSIPTVPAVHLNYGQASILTPSDFQFSRDGVMAEGNINNEMAVIGDLNMETIEGSRSWGSVLPLLDSERTRKLVLEPEIIEV